jgi:CRISPR-associated endonuclease Csn1
MTALAVKNRDDHRHHAIDAIVIALTSRRTLQLLSSWNASEKFNRRTKARFQLPRPWDDIFLQSQKAIANIIVSHKVNKRVRGALHEETIYGRLKMPFTGMPAYDEKQQPYYVVRKSLSGMQDTNPVYKIVDPIVKETVFQRLIEKGINEHDLREEKKVKIPKDAFVEPLYMPAAEGKKAPRILSVRIAVPATKMLPLHSHGDSAAFVEPGNNHHITIFERQTPKGKERKGIIISLFQAVRRVIQKQSPIQRSMDGWDFICSLQKNELFIRDYHPDEINLEDKSQYHTFAESVYRVQKFTEGEINLRLHRLAVLKAVIDNKEVDIGRWICAASTLSGFKVRISPIGKLEIADD